MDSIWTGERVEELKILWVKGDSATVIGAAMGFTRSAILGKVHRLELTQRSPRGVLEKATREPLDHRVRRKSVFDMPEKKPRFRAPNPDRAPALLAVVSPITGAFLRSERKRPHQPEYTKSQLRDQLTQAVQNTARMA